MLVGGVNVIYAERYILLKVLLYVMSNRQSVKNARLKGGKNECTCLKGMYPPKIKSV